MSQDVSKEALVEILEVVLDYASDEASDEVSEEVYKVYLFCLLSTKVDNFTLFLLIATSNIIILNSVETLLAL